MRNLFRFGYVAALFGVRDEPARPDPRAEYRKRAKGLKMTYEDLQGSVKGKLDRKGLYNLSSDLEKRSMVYRIHESAPSSEPPIEGTSIETDIARLRERVFGDIDRRRGD